MILPDSPGHDIFFSTHFLLRNFMRAVLVLASAAGIALGLTAAFATTSQRALVVVAMEDVAVFDVDEEMKQTGILPKGERRQILWCEDNKSMIEPVISIDGRQRGQARGEFRIVRERTGILSRPQFLRCADL